MSMFEDALVAGPIVGNVGPGSATLKIVFDNSVDTDKVSVIMATGRQPTRSDTWISNPAVHLSHNNELDFALYEFDLPDLSPSTTYNYSLVVHGDVVETASGSFRTFPPEGEKADFRCAFASCSRKIEKLAPYGSIARENPLFFLHMGDLHYYHQTTNPVNRRIEQYIKHMSKTPLAAMMRRLAFSYVWDDHDFLTNDAGGLQQQGRNLALAAYDWLFPHHPFAVPEEGLNQAFWVGKTRFLLADSRFNQSGSTADDPRIFSQRQLDWISGACELDADLFVLLLTFPWISTEHGKNNWGDYPANRQALLDHIPDDVRGRFCIISGDAHMLAIDDGANSPGGIPVFHAASLDSSIWNTKGGPYSKGGESPAGGKPGDGILGKYQYGSMSVSYARNPDGQPIGAPTVRWVGRRAKEDDSQTTDIIWHSFTPA